MGDASMVRDRIGVRASSADEPAALGERLVAYLHEHPDRAELTAKRIAAVHGISERYVYVVLGRMGVSLGGWIRERRLLMAAEALADADAGDVTISTIAHRWGFADHPHFCREFKRRFGVSPSEWRRGACPGARAVGGAGGLGGAVGAVGAVGVVGVGGLGGECGADGVGAVCGVAQTAGGAGAAGAANDESAEGAEGAVGGVSLSAIRSSVESRRHAE